MDGYKVCTRCKLLLPASAFAKNAARKDGLQNMCKECRKKYDAERMPIRKKIAEESRATLRVTEKTCPDCGRRLSVRHFYESCANADGYTTYCKTCMKRQARKRYKESVEQHKDKEDKTK